MNISTVQLVHQYGRMKKAGWLPYFASAPYDVADHILLGLGSRETNLFNELGDGGHGHGILQVDDRSFPEWCASDKWRDVRESINMGAFVMRSKFNGVEAKKIVPEADVLPVAVAAFNCGVDLAVAGYIHSQNPDVHTTGHDYSRDVLQRAAVFRRLLENDK